jgi:hypothetical protein
MASSDSRNSCEFADCAAVGRVADHERAVGQLQHRPHDVEPDVRVTHLMRAPAASRLTKLSLCRSVTATAVWHTPVQRFGGVGGRAGDHFLGRRVLVVAGELDAGGPVPVDRLEPAGGFLRYAGTLAAIGS